MKNLMTDYIGFWFFLYFFFMELFDTQQICVYLLVQTLTLGPKMFVLIAQTITNKNRFLSAFFCLDILKITFLELDTH